MKCMALKDPSTWKNEQRGAQAARSLYFHVCRPFQCIKISPNPFTNYHFDTNCNRFLIYDDDIDVDDDDGDNNNANMRAHIFNCKKFLKRTKYLCICSYAVAVCCCNNDVPAVMTYLNTL